MIPITDWIPVITALTSLVAAIGSAVGVIISSRNNRALGEVKHQTNSLVEKLGDSKLAQGLAEGTARGLEQARTKQEFEKLP